MHVLDDGGVPIKIWATDLEEEAILQVLNLSHMPFIHNHVAVMPDAHAGKGSTVGTVIATQGVIIPAAVGVDIGCGMQAMKMPFKVDRLQNLDQLRSSIERSIPVGHRAQKEVVSQSAALFATEHCLTNKEACQIGTLGGGNHFIEVCADENQDVWVMLHSGSRNLGKTRAEKHIDVAKGIMKRYFIDLPDRDLAYLAQQTPEFDAYLKDMYMAQNYAKLNRDEMMRLVVRDVCYHVYGSSEMQYELDFSPFLVDCHHNFTQMENHYGSNVWITRKGAVSARNGQFGIIPGSMGTKSYIVKGKGNPESFNSCSHGAGRTMSRTQARKQFTLDDLKQQTKGVECRKDSDVIDEIPGAYKDIDVVMANQSDLVEVVHTLKQLLCVKG